MPGCTANTIQIIHCTRRKQWITKLTKGCSAGKLNPKAKQPGGCKNGAAKQSRINQTTLVRTRSDIMLQPSGLEYYHDQSVK